MKKMSTTKGQATGQEWATKKNVLAWETQFAKDLVRPLINPKDLERDMTGLKNLFKEDTDGAKSAILIVLEEDGEDRTVKTLWQTQFWHPRKVMNIDHLEIYFREKGQKLKEKCPYLSRIQENRANIKYVQHLSPIIELQKMLKTKFDGNLDLNEICKSSVKDFINNHSLGGSEWNKIILDYLGVLESLKTLIFQTDAVYGIKAKNALLEQKGDMEEQIIDEQINSSILFPNQHGLGAFAIAIVRLLVDIHNKVVGGNSQHYLPHLSLEDFEDAHLIKFEKQEELNILLLANSRYELEVCGKGQPTHWELDEIGLDTMIYEKFFQNVPLLDEKSAPRFAYVGESLSNSRLNDKITQDKRLPNSIAGNLERELVDARVVGYVISKIEIVRDILAEVGMEDLQDEPLLNECMSRLRINLKGQIKAMRNVQLKHIDALLRHLGLIKAKLLTLKREDPFMNKISDDFKQPLNEKLMENLDRLCHHMKPEITLECIYGAIVEKLTISKTETENFGEWPLRDVIFAYLEAIDENEKSVEIYQYLAQEMLVKHSAACFAYIVNRH